MGGVFLKKSTASEESQRVPGPLIIIVPSAASKRGNKRSHVGIFLNARVFL